MLKLEIENILDMKFIKWNILTDSSWSTSILDRLS